MIWATVAEVRQWWTDQQDALGVAWPALPLTDPPVQMLVDSASRTLGAKIVRWPVLDEDTERAEDEAQRGHLVVAVGEVIRARREAAAAVDALGGGGAAAVIAGGGSITASKLSVSGGSKQGGGGGVRVGESALQVPIAAYDALMAAGLIGGSVASW
jgi:hypothetical protein